MGNLDGIGTFMVVGFIAIILVLLVGIWAGIDFMFLDDVYKSKHIVCPDMTIDTKNINGITTSDTTYVYHFKK